MERNIYAHIERLVHYGTINFGLCPGDAMYARNRIYAALKLDGAVAQEADTQDIAAMDTPDDLLEPLLGYAQSQGIITESERSLFDTELMGLLLPAPSQVHARFTGLMKSSGSRAALDDFYRTGIRSNYIRMRDVRKNLIWTAKADKADLVVTINLSKPEKDNKEIARLKSLPQKSYPRCMLCFENMGYSGRADFPARHTLRFLPIELAGEQWFLQFSPYVYYDQHCIAFSMEHKPMTLDRSTFTKLTDFLDLFPHYFIGSNACLPIVGGSILTHEHFQGGGYEMPMHKCGSRRAFSGGFHGVSAEILDWYNSVITLRSEDAQKLADAAGAVLETWQNYSDESAGILAFSGGQPHNAVTPIARKENGSYRLDLILRNNRTDEMYPDGIFHAHPSRHNIKKEGIGIIEVMGLFILPGRLQRECAAIAQILTGELKSLPEGMEAHSKAAGILAKEHGTSLSAEQAEKAVKEYINQTCISILEDTAVFKNHADGQSAFERFMRACGYTPAD